MLENSTEIAIQLLADGDNSRAILICDGTYERHQSSSNYSVQRGSYSTHKKDNLFKPFMIVSPNGYILDVFGPFSARPNDASIMKMLLRDEKFCSFLAQNDIFVLDRGFRDCVRDLQDKSLTVFTPAFSYGRQTLTNYSQLITHG